MNNRTITCKKLIALLFICLLSISTSAGIKMKPTPLTGLDYKESLHPGSYNQAIPTPESLLGFEVGQRTATPEQIVKAINSWDAASDKMVLVEYARSHEKRPLYYAIISSPENLAKVDAIKADLGRLAHPEKLDSATADQIINRLPAVAWMAYSIHGNESSGSDAALAAIYQLIASEEADIKELLAKSVIIIDPSMNPDGRARFTKALEQSRGVAPNVDDQSILHSGIWPYGRSNHYMFDLNRDFIYAVHPETEGRVRAINQWYPQLVVDGHEMGAQDTYLFGPPMEPINKNVAPSIKKWANLFAEEQAASFDKKNWPYYTGEWADDLYPGYTTYSEFRGSINILYEQARMAEDGVRQANERIVSYQESVHHQLVSTIANLKTLAKHSKSIYKDFLAERRKNISGKSQYADISYALLPTSNKKRWKGFIRLMELQGFEMFTTTKEMSFANARDQKGNLVTAKLPEGTLVIRNRQPEAPLVAAMLEFDTKIDDAVLIEERRRVLRDGSSVMYDTTAWNLSMMHGLKAFTIPAYIDSNLTTYKASESTGSVEQKPNTIAYVIDGSDDASVSAAARLLEQGVKVRINDKVAILDGQRLERGSLLINRYDNEFFQGDLDEILKRTTKELSISAVAISSGLGEGDLPDIGGSHFRLLEKPRIAMLARGRVSPYDFGAIWHSIDSNLGIRHSHINLTTFGYNDLRRYNTLVIPNLDFGNIEKSKLDVIKTWVEAGGTLIAVNGAVPGIVDPEAEFSSVRLLENSFENIDKYALTLQREWLSSQNSFPEVKETWSHDVAETIRYPWVDGEPAADKEQLEKQEKWQSKFMPAGAFAAARTDNKHWLTFGVNEELPVLVSKNPVLMSDDNAEAVVRFGVYDKMSKSQWKKVVASFKDKPVVRKAGWSYLPDQHQLKLRMSGLLWPEASQRIANSAYLTREAKGQGQIILFSGEPVFRGSTKGTNRLLLNALVYGAGLGTHVANKP